MSSNGNKRVFSASSLLGAVVLLLAACTTVTKEGPVPPLASGRFDHLIENAPNTDAAAAADNSKLEPLKTAKDARDRAEKALGEKNPNKAVFYYVKALEFDEKDVISLKAIGDLQMRAGSFAIAAMAYQMLLNLEPDNISAEEGLGMSKLRVGDYAEAQKHLAIVVERDPQRVASINGLAVTYDVTQDFERSAGLYGKAFQVAPNSPLVLNNFAYSRYLAGDWERAEQSFIKLLNRFPSHYQGCLNYGLLLARRGRLKDSLLVLERVLSPAAAYNELGYIMMLEGDYVAAERLLDAAISESPTYFQRAYENRESVRALRAASKPEQDSLKETVLQLRRLPKGVISKNGESTPDKHAAEQSLDSVMNERNKAQSRSKGSPQTDVGVGDSTGKQPPIEKRFSLGND